MNDLFSDQKSDKKFTGFSSILMNGGLVFIVIVSLIATFGFFADNLYGFVPQNIGSFPLELHWRGLIMGIIGVLLVDGMSFLWLAIRRYNASGVEQMTLSYQMAVFGVVTAIIMSLAQFILVTMDLRGNFEIRRIAQTVGNLWVSVYAVTQFGAVWWYHQVDPLQKNALQMAKREAAEQSIITQFITKTTNDVIRDLETSLKDEQPQLVQHATNLLLPQIIDRVASAVEGEHKTTDNHYAYVPQNTINAGQYNGQYDLDVLSVADDVGAVGTMAAAPPKDETWPQINEVDNTANF